MVATGNRSRHRAYHSFSRNPKLSDLIHHPPFRVSELMRENDPTDDVDFALSTPPLLSRKPIGATPVHGRRSQQRCLEKRAHSDDAYPPDGGVPVHACAHRPRRKTRKKRVLRQRRSSPTTDQRVSDVTRSYVDVATGPARNCPAASTST